MGRRRKKNNLLTRIIVASVAAHAIALPIAAHFGAFDKVRERFGQARVVMVNVPAEKERAEKQQKKPAKKTPQTTKKGPSLAHHSGPKRSSKPNPFQPKVIAGATDGGEGNGGPAVDPNGTGKAGELPTAPVTKPPTAPEIAAPEPATKPTKPAVAATPTEPVSAVATPKPASPEPLKFAQVETTYAPDPVIPDDLRSQPFEKTLVVEADVSVSGSPENIRVADSTGTKELDEIGLSTAKQYKFKPATLGDQPVEGHVRFRIIFKVE